MGGETDRGTTSRVQQCIEQAIVEMNAVRAPAERLPTDDPSLRLIGADAVLDSLGFVNFAVGLETALQAEFGSDVSVMADLLAMSDPSEIGTVEALRRYVSGRVAATG